MSRISGIVSGRRTAALIAAAVLFAVEVLVFVTSSFFDHIIDHDEAYQALNCRFYGDSPMAMLTFAIGHGWTSVFGDTLLSLRLLARLCYLVTVALPLWYFYRKTADAAWTFLLGAFMLALVQADHILFYGWDVGAFPFISALLVGLLCYLDRPTVARATVCGALCALMILSRVTTAVAGIPALFWIIIAGARRSPECGPWRCAGGAAVGFAVAALAGMLLLKGSVAGYMAAWNGDNIISGHGVGDIADGYLRSMKFAIRFCSSYIGYDVQVAALCILAVAARRYGALLCGAGTVFLSLKRILLMHSGFMPMYFCFIVLVLYAPLRSLFGKEAVRVDRVRYWLVIVFAVLFAIGSDSFLMKLMYFYSVPVSMLLLWRWRRGFLKYMFIMFTVPTVAYFACDRIQSFGEVVHLGEKIPRHNHIYDTPDGYTWIAPVVPVVESLKSQGKSVGSYGVSRYTVSYLLEEGKPYRFQDFHTYHVGSTRRTLAEFCRRYDVLVLSEYDAGPEYGWRMPYREVDSVVRANGFAEVAGGGEFHVYEKRADKHPVTLLD